MSLWSESWRDQGEWIRELASRLETSGASVLHGGSFDRWELEVRSGTFGSARLLMAFEEYPRGRQLVWWMSRPRFSLFALSGAVACAALAAGAASGGGVLAAAALAVTGIALLARTLRDAAAATGGAVRAIEAMTAFTETANRMVEREVTEEETDVAEPAVR